MRARLAAIETTSDRFTVNDREVYWSIDGLISESPLFGKKFDAAIGTSACTSRNVNTVRKLVHLLAAGAGAGAGAGGSGVVGVGAGAGVGASHQCKKASKKKRVAVDTRVKNGPKSSAAFKSRSSASTMSKLNKAQTQNSRASKRAAK